VEEAAGAARRRRQWQRWLADPAWDAQPTDAHRALVDLERRGCLRAVVTRNIDGLHQRAGSCPALVVELCGTMRSALCLACGDQTPMSEALARVRSGEDDPACLTCGGALSAAVVAAGQPALTQALDVARGAVVDCDAVIVAGSHLRNEVDAALITLASRSGVAVVIINPEPTPCDALAAAVVRTPVAIAVPLLAAAVRAGGRRE
jgi:NAD-dependent deacetylase